MSSFRKRVVRRPIPGTRTSPQTGQVITSSGNLSLDIILGGGLPIGSICLIEEDKYATYSKVLAKYFLAEGVVSNHSMLLGSLDDNPKQMRKKLPKECTEPSEEESIENQSPNDLRIAWRYNNLPMVNFDKSNEKIGHNFNLMEHMDIAYAYIATWSNRRESDAVDEHDETFLYDTYVYDYENDATQIMQTSKEIDMENSKNNSTPNPALREDDKQDTSDDKNATTSSTETSASSSMPTPPSPLCRSQEEEQLFTNSKYLSLLRKVNSTLFKDKFCPPRAITNTSLYRVCLTSLASPHWFDENFEEDLLKFLTILKATIRTATSVCFITMPMHLIAKYDAALVSKIRNLVDYSIELESFAGSDKETNPVFKEYHGLIHLRKMSAVNTLSAYMPDTTDFAFKLKRKKFVIEKLHLPPELQDASGAEQDTKPTLSCGSNMSPNPNISLDF